MNRTSHTIWFKINCTQKISGFATKRSLEKNSQIYNHISTQAKQTYKRYQLIHHQFLPKKGDVIGFDGFKRIIGSKIHVAVE